MNAPADSSFTDREVKQSNRLKVVLFVISIFFAVEFAGAIAARSVVLRADALHLLMDIVALAMSLFAMRLAVRCPTPRFTFGLRRAEPVAGLINAVLILVATSHIVAEAVREFTDGSAPEADIMLIVAAAALVVNGFSAWLLHGAMHEGHPHTHGSTMAHDNDSARSHTYAASRGHSLNLRGAWLHLIGDTLGSLAALVAAIILRAGGPSYVDPIASFMVAVILLIGAIRLIRDASLVLLEAAPSHLPVDVIRQKILSFPEVSEIHSLHVWTLGAGHDAMTVHARAAVAADPQLAFRISRDLREQFDVEYVTIQIEVVEADCPSPEP